MTEQEPSLQFAQGHGIAQAHGTNASAIVNIGLSPEQVRDMLRAAGDAQQANIDALSRQFDTTREAVRGFFKILNASDVPVERLPQALAEIAQRHRNMLLRLSAVDSEDPATKAAIDEARAILSQANSIAEYDRSDALLASAEASTMRAIGEAEALEKEAKEAVRRKRRTAAATRAERGELSLTRLDYLQASQHFKAAADMLAESELKLRVGYVNRQAGALCKYGEEKGDNAVLVQAIGVYREALREPFRRELQLDWAMVQNNLGFALFRLGERESGTERLEEAVAAFREALKESTRECVPLRWAMVQNNLGLALWRLGERESGTKRLEEAVATYREALKELTRERVPLRWAATQSNLGGALSELGARESGTERLEEAVAVFHEALKERTRERVPLDWAATQNNLGIALCWLGERESAMERLEEAMTAIELASTVYHETGMPQYENYFEPMLRSLRELIAQSRSQ
jgi:tetratricopeptide (TPR) repeat protein